MAVIVGVGVLLWRPALALGDPSPAGGRDADGGVEPEGAGPDAQAAPHDKPTLRVAAAGSAPFIIPHANRRSAEGLSMDVLHQLAEEADFEPAVAFYTQISSALTAVATGHADLAVGPISVTAARAAQVQFLQPYHAAHLGILTRPEAKPWARFTPFLSRAFGLAVITLALVLMLVGVLVWLAERQANPTQFPKALLPGVANGMWFALVTMTTVGYGDRAPLTRVGRLITGVWMIVAMLTASSLTAGIATALTLSQIQPGAIRGLADMSGHTVAAVAGTPALSISRRYGAEPFAAKSRAEALSLLTSGQVDALLYDLPVLEHYQEQHPDSGLLLLRTELQVDDYAFAVALDSPMAQRLNVALIALKERGELRDIEGRWLP